MRQPAVGDDDADLPDDSGSDDDPDDDPDNDSNGQPIDGFDFSPDDVHFDEHGVLHASDEILIKLREYLGLDSASRSGCESPGAMRCQECLKDAPEGKRDQIGNTQSPNRDECDICNPCGTCHPDNCEMCEPGDWAQALCPTGDCCHDRVCCLSLPECWVDLCLFYNDDTACTLVPVFCGFNPSTACELNDCDPDNGCYSYPKCDDADPCTADACYLGVCSYTASPCDPECYDLEAKCLAECLNAPTPECCSDPCGSECDSPMAKCQADCQGSHPECCDDPDPCCGSTDPCCDDPPDPCCACGPCEDCVEDACVDRCDAESCEACVEGACENQCNECQKCEGGECVPDLEKDCLICDTGDPAPERCQDGECVPANCTFTVLESPITVCASAWQFVDFPIEYDCDPECGLALELVYEPLFVSPGVRISSCEDPTSCGAADGWEYYPGALPCPVNGGPTTGVISILPWWEVSLDCNDYNIRVHALIDGQECASDIVTVKVRDPDLDIEGILEQGVPGVPDECEWDLGGFIPWNIDDDNANGKPDFEDFAELSAGGAFTPPAQENDLAKIAVELPDDYDSLADRVRLRYIFGNARIRVYQEDTAGSLTRLGQTMQTWEPGTSFPDPGIFRIEGVLPSQALYDVNMTLIHQHPATLGDDCEDWLRWTVVGVDLDVDSDNDGTIDPDNSSSGTDDKIEADPALPGKILAVNDDFDEGKVDGSGNPVPDNADLSPVTADGSDIKTDDMVRCDAEIFPKNDPDAEIKLTSSSSIVRVFAKNPNAAQPFVQGDDWQLVPFDENLVPDYFTQAGSYFGWQWWIEGLTPGVETLTFKYEGHNLAIEDKVRLTVLQFDIDGDTDQSGIIDGTLAEDLLETNLPGVIVLANVDDDNDNGVRDGFLADAGTVNNGGTVPDSDDLAPIILRQCDVPAGWKVVLVLAEEDNVEFGIAPEDVVRIFTKRGTGATPILGPDTSFIFALPESDPHGVDIATLKTQDIELGVEGLIFAGEVKLLMWLVSPDASTVLSDEIQIKVAPFIMLPNTAPPSRMLVADHDPAFVGTISGIVGAANIIETGVGIDVWPQDAWEIGYSSWPGATGQVEIIPVSFETLRQGRPLEGWGRSNLLGPTPGNPDRTGLIHRLADMNKTEAYGGNLEVTPPLVGHPRGRIVIGSNMQSEQKEFLVRQGVQTPSIELDVGWLKVGHVDEVVNIVGGTGGPPEWLFVFASPEKGWDIVADPTIPPHTPLFYGNSADPIKAGTATSATATTLVDDTANFLDGTPWKYVRIYDDGSPPGQQGTKGQVAEVTVTDATTLSVVKVWNLPNAQTTYDAILGTSTASGNRAKGQAAWYDNPDSTSAYVLAPTSKQWQRRADPEFGRDFPALITVGELARDATGLGIENTSIQNKIDGIRNQLLPVLPVFFEEVPALFLGTDTDPARKAFAYVPGLVNFQVWANAILLPKPFGPRIGSVDQFELHANTQLQTGVRTTHFIDNWDTYHRLFGEVHCGTNVIRDAPSSPGDEYLNWWE